MTEFGEKMVLGLVTTFVTAVGAIILGLINLRGARKREKELELLKDELGRRAAETDARRVYEFEARKRLYTEYEPLLFIMTELMEEAYLRIRHLAKSARNGNLGKGGLLTGNPYFYHSTLYRLFAPSAIFKLIRFKLTLIDLKIEKRIYQEYQLFKMVYRIFSDDFDFARLCRREYLPYGDGKGTDKQKNDKSKNDKTNPAVYRKQGFARGITDNFVDVLADRRENGDVEGIKGFGHFENWMNAQRRKTGKSESTAYLLDYIGGVFRDFHPGDLPLLWQILFTQALMYRVILMGIKRQRRSKADCLSFLAECLEDREELLEFEYDAEYYHRGDIGRVGAMGEVASEYLRCRLDRAEKFQDF